MVLTQTILSQEPELPNAEIDGEVVLMSSQTGRYYSLGGTAAAIWKALANETTIGTVCAALNAEFAVDQDTCRRDVEEFIELLLRHKLIRAVEA